MYRAIFQYRWAALLFVALTIFSTVRLVGTESEDGKLAEVQQQVAQQRSQLAKITGEPAPAVADAVDNIDENADFASDQDLFDQAGGMDPNPPDDSDQSSGEASDGGPGDGGVELVDSNAAEG